MLPLMMLNRYQPIDVPVKVILHHYRHHCICLSSTCLIPSSSIPHWNHLIIWPITSQAVIEKSPSYVTPMASSTDYLVLSYPSSTLEQGALEAEEMLK
jgi:hypothetical protein